MYQQGLPLLALLLALKLLERQEHFLLERQLQVYQDSQTYYYIPHILYRAKEYARLPYRYEYPQTL